MSGDNNDPMIPLDAKAAGEAPSASHGAGNGAMPPQPPPDLTEIRKQLFTRGYKILPNRGKAPVIKGWSDPDYLARELTDSSKGTVLEKIERWPGRFPDALSTGVWLWDKLRVIDIDVSDATMVEALLDAIRKLAPEIADRAPMRFGATPRVALFVRAPDHEEPKSCSTRRAISSMWGRRRSTGYEVLAIAVPAEGEDAPTHAIDIFGGEPTKRANVPGNSGSTARTPTMTTARWRANMAGLRTGPRCTRSIWPICRRSAARPRARSSTPSMRWRKSGLGR